LEEICKSDAQSLQLNWAGATLIDDYSNPIKTIRTNSFKIFFTPSFSISSSLNVFKLANKDFRCRICYGRCENTELLLLPRLSPLVFAGFGLERIRYSRIDILNSMLDWNILPVQKKINFR
jgi:hypothetical protein